MGIVSEVSSHPQLSLFKISSWHAPSLMTYAKRCLAFSLLYSPIHWITFQCNWGYGSPIEMGIVSEVSSRPLLGLSKISIWHAPSPMSYTKRCLAFSLLYSPIHWSTFQCNWGYGSPIEMGIVSDVSWHLQLGLSKISSRHAPSPMSYAKRCLAFSLLYPPIHWKNIKHLPM